MNGCTSYHFNSFCKQPFFIWTVTSDSSTSLSMSTLGLESQVNMCLSKFCPDFWCGKIFDPVCVKRAQPLYVCCVCVYVCVYVCDAVCVFVSVWCYVCLCVSLCLSVCLVVCVSVRCLKSVPQIGSLRAGISPTRISLHTQTGPCWCQIQDTGEIQKYRNADTQSNQLYTNTHIQTWKLKHLNIQKKRKTISRN